METYAPPRPLQPNPGFRRQREAALRALDLSAVDEPVRGLVRSLNRLPHCFTLQSCYGHFVWADCGDPHNLRALPAADPGGLITYRIAYLALAVDDRAEGRDLLRDLGSLERIAPGYVQLGTADWFWTRQVNSFALQVEPERLRSLDQAALTYQEALRVQEARSRFFESLEELASRAISAAGPRRDG